MSPARLWAASGLVGLALLTNLRFALMLVAIPAAAWRLRAPVRGLRAWHWAVALGVMLAALAPTLLFFLLRPPNQRGGRLETLPAALAQNVAHPAVLAQSGHDLLRWWSNVAEYLSPVTGSNHLNAPALALAAAALGWVLWEGLRALWRREGSPLAALLALSLLGFWSTSALIYFYYPRNMAPLHAVFGLSLGLALTRLAQALRPRVGAAAGFGLAALLTIPFAQSAAQLVRVSPRTTWPLNLAVERTVTGWLVAHPLPGSRVVLLNPEMVGVFEGLSAGVVRPVHAHLLFRPCGENERVCMTSRMGALLRWNGGRPLRLVLIAPESSRPAADQGPSYEDLRAIVRAAGGQTADEFRARTARGTDGMLVMRVSDLAPPPSGR